MPEGEGRYTPEEALEEAEKMKEVVKSGEASDYSKAVKIVEENVEKELSPEVVEKIIEKVQDINKDGTAFSLIQFSKRIRFSLDTKVLPILKKGLLGGKDIPEKTKSESWKTARKQGEGGVHFNIVGRMRDYNPESSRSQIRQSSYMHHQESAFGIIFDISDWKESDKWVFGLAGKHINLERKHFYPSQVDFEKTFSTDGRALPDSESGFVAAHRIAPRDFKGIFVASSRSEFEPSPEQGTKRKEVSEKDDHAPMSIVETVNYLAEAFEKDQRKAIPIYDEFGNLLWPKKMSYEEVKKFVAERDTLKEG